MSVRSTIPLGLTDGSGGERSEDVLIAVVSQSVAVVCYDDWSVGTGRSPSMIKMKVTELIEYTDNVVSEAEAL